MNNLERQLLITARLYEEKLQKVLLPSDYDELQKETFRYLMINELVTLPWNRPYAKMIKKQYHITENDVKEFYNKFWILKQEDDHGKPACDLQFGEDPEEEPKEEPEESINILNDCAGCVFYNSEDDCCENNARLCTYKEEE